LEATLKEGVMSKWIFTSLFAFAVAGSLSPAGAGEAAPKGDQKPALASKIIGNGMEETDPGKLMASKIIGNGKQADTGEVSTAAGKPTEAAPGAGDGAVVSK
jgi:hypothetical protein